jgi:hypothetical protein
MVYEMVNSYHELAPSDGLCRIGISKNAAYLVIGFDTTVNVALNGLFIWLLMPLLRSRAHQDDNGGENATHVGSHTALRRLSSTTTSVMTILKYKRTGRRATPFKETVKGMLWRNVLGSTMILALTLVNNILSLFVADMKLSHVCLLTCLSDSELSFFPCRRSGSNIPHAYG